MWPSIVILATYGQALSSWQHVAKHCHPGNMWPSIVILATCGQALSSWQHMAKHCHPGNMWPSIVILATCGRAWSSWQHMAKHCHPGNIWPSIVILATCGQTLSSWQHHYHETKLWASLKSCKKVRTVYTVHWQSDIWLVRDQGNNVEKTPNVIQWDFTVSSWQHVAEYCHPGNIWRSIVVLATCGQALSSWQHVAKHCRPGNIITIKQNYEQAWSHVKKYILYILYVLA